MFKYQELIERLSVEEVNSTIKKMVDTYDLMGKFFETSWDKERTFKSFFNLSPDFIELFDSMVEVQDDEELFERYGFGTRRCRATRQDIYDDLLEFLKSEARRVLRDREHLKIPAGSKVDFDSCLLHNSYNNKVEFYKDGGWGIAEEDGLVIVKNHMVLQPSKTRSLLDGLSYLSSDIKTSCPYRIIQDSDTEKYGILSYDTFYETVHCLYEEIEVDYNYSEHHFFIKAKKNGKWGCFDEKCALVIDFKYDDISLNGGYIECTKDAGYLPHDTTGRIVDESALEGKYLYDEDGTLMIGGYDNLICDYGYFKIYFGTFYENYIDREFGEYMERLNYDSSKCLVLDKNFQTIMNVNGFFRLQKGQIFRSLTEVEQWIPSEFLLSHQVDLSNLYEGYIYLKDFKFKGENICKDKSVITILKLNENKEIAWTEYVNAILESDYNIHIYRKGVKYGVFGKTVFKPAVYDAISCETPDDKIYVAVFESRQDSSTLDPDNPNYDSCLGLFIRYYTIDANGELVRVEDNWVVFNPRECKWYPYDFIKKHYREEIDDFSGSETERTDEDSWYAMTDGMYGEYPGSGWDPEAFGY